MTSSRKSTCTVEWCTNSISVYAFFMGGLSTENHLGMAQRKCEGVFDYDTKRAINTNGISINVQWLYSSVTGIPFPVPSVGTYRPGEHLCVNPEKYRIIVFMLIPIQKLSQPHWILPRFWSAGGRMRSEEPFDFRCFHVCVAIDRSRCRSCFCCRRIKFDLLKCPFSRHGSLRYCFTSFEWIVEVLYSEHSFLGTAKRYPRTF